MLKSPSSSSKTYFQAHLENTSILNPKSIVKDRAEEKRTWLGFSIASLISALGLLATAVSYYSSRTGNGEAQLLYWLGTVLILVPALFLVVPKHLPREERVAILIVLGLSMYLTKVMYSPTRFTFPDELQHWRSTYDVLSTHHLFTRNPILTVSPFYPGLEIFTSALVSLTGLSIYQAGLLVIGAGRLLMVLALFLFYEKVTKSSRLASFGTLIYMANPHFLLFDAQFAYESLAIPLATLTLFAATKYNEFEGTGKLGIRLVILLGIAAVIVTHHVTSFFLIGIFLLSALILALVRVPIYKRFVPTWIGLLGLAGIVAWLAIVANEALSYLTSPITAAMQQIILLILREEQPRTLFSGSGPSDLYSQVLHLLGIAAILLVLIAIPFGVLKVWQKYRYNSMALALTLVAITYPITLVLRYTSWGLVVASRTAPYIFLGIGFVLAVGFGKLNLHAGWEKLLKPLIITGLAIIFIGTAASGLSAWGLPVLYSDTSYTNTADNVSAVVSQWTWNKLGPGNRFAADLSMQWILGAYGDQRPITTDADRIWIVNIYSQEMSTQEILETLRAGKVRYLLIDRRSDNPLMITANQLPASLTSANAVRLKGSPLAYSIFDGMSQADRIFDNGEIVIYDVGALTNGN